MGAERGTVKGAKEPYSPHRSDAEIAERDGKKLAINDLFEPDSVKDRMALANLVYERFVAIAAV